MDDSIQYIAASCTFAKTILNVSRIPYEFEKDNVLDAALEVLPLEKLYTAADAREKADPSWSSQDYLIQELLKWFKHDFFTWVNTLKCSKCGGDTSNIGGTQPTAEERSGGCGVTELHKCSICSNIERFPRYNNTLALLKYRKGRCGEWAHCFTALCRALGSRARYIWNSEDHVWTEVYSTRQDRWIHCDSCEEAWDNPTLYGNGWGKKMAYVIGFSIEGAKDVTKRYVRNNDKTLPRNSMDQDALDTFLTLLTIQSRDTVSASQRELLEDQDQMEWAELESYSVDPAPTHSAPQPRQSGQGDWTKQRGEDGSNV